MPLHQDKIEILEKKLTEEPRNILYRNNLAYFYHESGNLPKAIEHYQIVLSIDNDYLPANYALGGIMLKMGKTGESLVFYERALKKDPSFWQANFGIAMAHQSNKDFHSAALYFEKAIAQEGSYPDSYYYLAKCYEELKNYPKATRKYKEFVVLAVKAKPSPAYLIFLNEAKKKVEELKNKK